MPTSNTRAFGAVTTRPRRIAPAVAPAPAPAPSPTPAPDNVVMAPAPAPVATPVPAFVPEPEPDLEQKLSELAIEAPSEPTVPAFLPFAACYNEALGDMPPSILRALQDRLERKQYDLGVPDEAVHEAIAKTRASYQKKREAGRLRSARVRAERKAAKSAEPLASDEADPEPAGAE